MEHTASRYSSYYTILSVVINSWAILLLGNAQVSFSPCLYKRRYNRTPILLPSPSLSLSLCYVLLKSSFRTYSSSVCCLMNLYEATVSYHIEFVFVVEMRVSKPCRQRGVGRKAREGRHQAPTVYILMVCPRLEQHLAR